jgi:phosphatidylglycerophosphatase A
MRTNGSSLRHDPVSMSDARRAFAAHPFAAFIAMGFGSGLSPIMPGTAGSVVGLALAWPLSRWFASAHIASLSPVVGLLMSGLAAGLVGVVASGPVLRALGSEDPGCIVIDEISGQLIASAAVPLFWPYPSAFVEAGAWIASFVLFRFFDIVKPGPIDRMQNLPGGWGVVADDVGGGFAAAFVLAGLGWVAARCGWI